MIALPSYIDPELFSAFIEMRKEIKHPLTQAGQKLAIRTLMRLHNDGWDCNASLEDSVLKSYRGLFEVRRIAVDPMDKPKAVQVSDDHKARCTPMPESLRRMIRQ
jgi:hypothetical protein